MSILAIQPPRQPPAASFSSLRPRHGRVPAPGRSARGSPRAIRRSRRAPATLAEVEMSLPLFDRVMRPFLDKIGNRLNRNAGQGSTDALQEKLNLAGRPWGLTASGFLALRLLSMVLFTAIGFALALFGALTMPLLVVVPAGGLILGTWVRRWWSRAASRSARRRSCSRCRAHSTC